MAKKKAARRSPSQKRATPTKKRRSSGNDCRQVFDDRLSVASTHPIAHFSKGLEHDPTTGDVDASHFQRMIEQLKKLNHDPEHAAKKGFQLRADTSESLRHFVNPQSGWALDTAVTAPCCYTIPAPPQLDSEEEAAEIIELYWMSLLRDVPFAQWDDHPLLASAAAELSTLPL